MAQVLERDLIHPPFGFYGAAGRNLPTAVECRTIRDTDSGQCAIFINIVAQNITRSLALLSTARVEAEYADGSKTNLTLRTNPFTFGVIFGGWRRVTARAEWSQGNLLRTAPTLPYTFASDDFTLDTDKELRAINWFWKER